MNQAKEKTPVRRTSSRGNLVAWILCLVAAFIMWIYVMAVESPEHEQIFSHLPVELTGTEVLADNELAVYSGYGTMIDVTLSGKKSVVSRLSERDIVVTADLKNITDGGRYTLKVTVDVPAGCKLAGMSQNTISVYVDQAMTMTFDLTEHRINTNLPEGCFTGTVEFPVDKITVRGPRNVLTRVERAEVTLNLADVTRTTTLNAPVVLVNVKGEEMTSPYIEYSPTMVSVTVPVYKSVTVPVRVGFRYGFLNSENTEITVTPSTVTATGDPDVIDRGSPLESVILDEKTEFENGQLTKTVSLNAVDGVTLSTTQAEITAVIDSSIKTREFLIPGSNIVDTGAKEGVNYTWDRTAVPVVLMGPVDMLAKIEVDDISLVFDMSPYNDSNTGTIRVRADVWVDSLWRDEVFPLGTYEINVTFTD
ncbi:MAG: hypothetical protein K6A33_01345 [Clostridiales bacterium]|nr:hypothetical protein [Clostridiales bacterium]